MLSSDEDRFHEVNRPMTVPMERVENRILSIRGHRVMVDTGEKMELVAKCDRCDCGR
jgi:hypothetical protein